MRRVRRADLVSLVAGAGITVLGGLLLGDQLDVFDLRFGVLTPICLAVVGAILLTSGLTRRS
jgi:hypothetical protein